MPNGTLKLYNKLTNELLVSLDILGTFNIEDNLNETPSNMKVKVITSDTYREEFQVNTVAYHEDTNSWWVIKSDESSYLTTGEYEHEIQLVEYLEFYAYRHLPNCAFAPTTYTLEQMLLRLFDIAKLSITVVYPDFLDEDKIMPFFSFENFTVANAIKNVARAINAIPKMSVGFLYIESVESIAFSSSSPSTPSNGDYWYNTDTNVLSLRVAGAWVAVQSTNGTTTPTYANQPDLNFVNTDDEELFVSQTYTPLLTFINRNGIDAAIKEGLNDEFPIAYEKNMNSNDQFTTRSVSNITNAKSTSLVISPLSGGFKIITPNSLTYNKDNAIVYLPSKIDKIEFIRLYPTIELVARGGVGPTDVVLYTGYYTNKDTWSSVIESLRGSLTTTYNLTNGEVDTAKSALPNPELQAQFNYDDNINKTNYGLTKTFFDDKLTIKNKFDFDTIDISVNTDVKDRTCHWQPFTNELVMSKTFRYGLDVFGFVNFYEANQYRLLVEGGGVGAYDLYLKIKSRSAGFFADRVPTEEVLIQVAYYPIADIKVSIDNDNDAQDEKFFNQSGKVIDAVSVSKLITSHTNDSVEGTKIRNARYESPNYDYTDILPLGQLVRDSNQLYVVTQRSIDGMVKNANEYYNVIYTLSRNRIARSENIVADSAVISYKTPDDNLVFRSQLYKDYIELSLEDINQDTPYLIMTKALQFGDTLAGSNFDFTVLAKNEYGTTPDVVRYVKNPTIFDLHKAKLMNVNWQDNNVLGFRLDSTGETFVQTPIVYTDELGKATNFELLFLDTTNIIEAREHFNDEYTPDELIPFTDLTEVDEDFYDDSVLEEENFSIRIEENEEENENGGVPYKKDPFEIPVFEYMIQGNDDYNSLGNVIIGNDLFTNFRTATGTTMRYHYQISNTRFTAENAIKLFTLPSSTDRVVGFARDGHELDLTLYSVLNPSTSPPTLTQNTTEFDHIGIYAYNGVESKFLFAINDYTMSSDSEITIYINNWKI
jgi:hypothetical protein